MVGIVDELLNTEHRWNDTDGNTEVLEGRGEGGGKNCLGTILPTTNPIWTALGLCPFIRGERLANKLPSHGTAYRQ